MLWRVVALVLYFDKFLCRRESLTEAYKEIFFWLEWKSGPAKAGPAGPLPPALSFSYYMPDSDICVKISSQSDNAKYMYTILATVDNLNVCAGHPDNHFIEFADSRKGRF